MQYPRLGSISAYEYWKLLPMLGAPYDAYVAGLSRSLSLAPLTPSDFEEEFYNALLTELHRADSDTAYYRSRELNPICRPGLDGGCRTVLRTNALEVELCGASIECWKIGYYLALMSDKCVIYNPPSSYSSKPGYGESEGTISELKNDPGVVITLKDRDPLKYMRRERFECSADDETDYEPYRLRRWHEPRREL